MNTEIYLVKFSNKVTGESFIVAVGDEYETISYVCMKGEREWKDLDSRSMKKDWKVEKKVKKINWD